MGKPGEFYGDLRRLHGEGKSSDVFTFSGEDGKAYVYKELRPDSWVMKRLDRLNLSLPEKQATIQLLYDVYRAYLQDYLVETSFVTSQNEKGEACVVAIQPKIEGKLLKDSPRSEIIQEQLAEIDTLVNEAESDPHYAQLPPTMQGVKDYREPTNIIVTPEQNLRIIDW